MIGKLPCFSSWLYTKNEPFREDTETDCLSEGKERKEAQILFDVSGFFIKYRHTWKTFYWIKSLFSRQFYVSLLKIYFFWWLVCSSWNKITSWWVFEKISWRYILKKEILLNKVSLSEKSFSPPTSLVIWKWYPMLVMALIPFMGAQKSTIY